MGKYPEWSVEKINEYRGLDLLLRIKENGERALSNVGEMLQEHSRITT